MPPIHESEIEWTEIESGKMNVRRKQLGEAAGGEELGCSLYELPPGERSWPYHYHTANEEAAYVLSGSGTLRLADETHRLTAGEYVAFPADETGGHEFVNDGEEPLRYLVFSTMNDPEVAVYPDSEKIGVFVGAPQGGRGERAIHGYYPMDADVDYWDGK
ncbi:MAG: cupin domain-containing protein [Natronomonas sp.]|nr:cupin domain-containing protein [Natronomonas sp.]